MIQSTPHAFSDPYEALIDLIKALDLPIREKDISAIAIMSASSHGSQFPTLRELSKIESNSLNEMNTAQLISLAFSIKLKLKNYPTFILKDGARKQMSKLTAFLNSIQMLKRNYAPISTISILAEIHSDDEDLEEFIHLLKSIFNAENIKKIEKLTNSSYNFGLRKKGKIEDKLGFDLLQIASDLIYALHQQARISPPKREDFIDYVSLLVEFLKPSFITDDTPLTSNMRSIKNAIARNRKRQKSAPV